jgi:hypothetical protein
MNDIYQKGYLAALEKFNCKEASMFEPFMNSMKQIGGHMGGLFNGAKGFLGGANPEAMLAGRNLMGSSAKNLMAPAALVGGGYMLNKMMTPNRPPQY